MVATQAGAWVIFQVSSAGLHYVVSRRSAWQTYTWHSWQPYVDCSKPITAQVHCQSTVNGVFSSSRCAGAREAEGSAGSGEGSRLHCQGGHCCMKDAGRPMTGRSSEIGAQLLVACALAMIDACHTRKCRQTVKALFALLPCRCLTSWRYRIQARSLLKKALLQLSSSGCRSC